jgi:hypothetical protein
MKLGETQPFASPEEALSYLQHHGVKGMRWGVRKDSKPVADVSAKASFSSEGLGHGNALFELHDPSSLKVTTTKGYADVRPVGGFANASVKNRHAELISALDEMRQAYPAVNNLKIEMVPMSRVPGQEENTSGSFAAVQAIKHGEARIMYNDVLGELEPHQTAFVKNWMPGVGTKNYIGYHEMGHLLAVAHGTQPPSYDLLTRGRARDINKYYKTNQKNHKKLLERHGLSYTQLRHLSDYAGTEPSEALAELAGHYHSPVMRQRLDADTQRKAQSLFDEMGGKT